MAEIYIKEEERRRLAARWIGVSMFSLHAWATLLVCAVAAGRESAVIAGMFSTVTFGIGATLVILLFDRAADVVLSRFTLPFAPPSKTQETVTRTVTTEAAEKPKES